MIIHVLKTMTGTVGVLMIILYSHIAVNAVTKSIENGHWWNVVISGICLVWVGWRFGVTLFPPDPVREGGM